jgi:hypothetical protein
VISSGLHFLNKKYINIKRYQLHTGSATMQHHSGSTDTHNQKIEKKIKKQKSPYNISDLTTAIHPPPRQQLK